MLSVMYHSKAIQPCRAATRASALLVYPKDLQGLRVSGFLGLGFLGVLALAQACVNAALASH